MEDAFVRALAVLSAPGAHGAAREEADAFVTQALESSPLVAHLLLARIAPPAPPAERHLAAVLLSTSVARHWRNLGDEGCSAVQAGVLAALGSSESPAELRALAHAADVIAQWSAVAGTPWDALLPALSGAALSPSAVHREAAMVLLGNLTESMGVHLHAHHHALTQLFITAARDPSAGADGAGNNNNTNTNTSGFSSRVREAALGALGQMAGALGARGDFATVAQLGPEIVACCSEVAAERHAARDEPGAAAALAALAAAVAVDSDAVFGPDLCFLLPAVDAALRVGTDPTLDPEGPARGPAFAVLGALAAAHRELLDTPRPTDSSSSGSGTVVPAELMLPPLCAAAVHDDGTTAADVDDAAGEAEAVGPAAAALAVLRQFALHLPPATVLPHVMAPIDAALGAGVAPPAGCLLALAAVTEGCACDIAEDAVLPRVLAAVAAGVASGDVAKKRAAAAALAELAEHAGHVLTELYSDQVLPLLTTALAAATQAETNLGAGGGGGGDISEGLVEGFSVPIHAAAAALCENFSNEEVAPGLPGLVPMLVGGAVASTMSPHARARCLNTLASVAKAAAWDFEPFAADTLSALAALAGAQPGGAAGGGGGGGGPDSLKSLAAVEGAAAVRARALAAMATVVAAVGVEAAPPGIIDALLDAATRGLSDGGGGENSSSSSVMRECSHRCFGRLAVVLERRLGPWLAGATSAAVAALGGVGGGGDAKDAGGGGGGGGGRNGRGAVTTGGIGEAMAAAETLGAFVNSCGSAVRPYMPSVLSALALAAGPTSPAALRTAALRSLEFSLHPLDNDDDEWKEGELGVATTKVPPERLASALPIAVDAATLLARVLAEEEEPEVALAAATSLETVVERACRMGRGVAAAAAQMGDAAAAATVALCVAVGKAKEAAEAVLEGAAGCQAELAEGGGGGHDGGDGEDTGTVFMDLEDQARRVLALLDSNTNE
jgi:hypothetical protein